MLERLWSKLGYLSVEDRELVRRAYMASVDAHRGQRRMSGDPYVAHPLAVAEILADLKMDASTLAAALLHDVVEDTRMTLGQVREGFGETVAALVDGVTKLSYFENQSRLEAAAENLRKMLLAMARDVRVILIKLADRLHNMRTLKPLPEDRRKAVAKETLDIYAPLAHRLGMSRLKWELEDTALRYLEPEAYHQIAEAIAERRDEREAYVSEISQTIRDALHEHGLDMVEVHGRPKGFYSIYQKMFVRGKDFSEIYDLLAVRIIVPTAKDCYAALGVVHALFKPIPGRFKDYIAMPKANLYQSLHTTVIGPNGRPFEIQIRTQEMHRTAEYGIAAHWVYKDGKTDPKLDSKLAWLRQMLEWEGETKEPYEFLETLRVDLFSDEVFAFTPKGMLVDLPMGSTPIDFAYRIHTDVGHHCVGAKVNGRIVPLDYRLRNGDIIEILTNKNSQGPSSDWLTFVKTSGARTRIRQWFKAKNRDDNVRMGEELVEREMRRLGLEPHELMVDGWLQEVSERFNFTSLPDLFASVGYGGVTAGQVVSRLREKLPQRLAPAEPRKSYHGYGRASNGVRVRGADNLLVKLARCCTPVPGDDIIGYVTRGKGVSVHRKDCPNLKVLTEEVERLADVAWDVDQAAAYPVELQIHGVDRSGLLADVANVVAETHVNIVSAKARGYRNRTAIVTVVLEIKHLGELSKIIEHIKKLPDVFTVERVAKERHG